MGGSRGRDRGRGTHLSWPLSRIGRMAAGLELTSGSAPGLKGTAVGPGGGKIAFEPQNPKTTAGIFYTVCPLE
ncbi:hypothetical protein N9M16_02360 [Candidatus Dependentiae bacterium]|nr:hypothetical protein [Candidatus Dependentiae bacterium]